MAPRRSLALVALAAIGATTIGCSSDPENSASTVVKTVSTTDDNGLPVTTEEPGSADSTIDRATSSSSDGASDTTRLDDRLGRAADALRAGDFSTMLRLLELSGLAADLEGRQVTILAPTEEAFRDIGRDQFNALLDDPSQIGDVLKRHVIDELITYDGLSKRTEVQTLSGESLPVTTSGGSVMIDGAVVSPPGADALSGQDGQEVAVFAIDRVLIAGR